MKFQNPSMQGSKHAVHQKVCKVKMPKVIKGHYSSSNCQNLFKS